MTIPFKMQKGDDMEQKELDEIKKFNRIVAVYFGVFLFMCLICVILFNTVFMLITVQGISMEDTIGDGDVLIATRYDVGADDLKRYDIVILTSPNDPDVRFIKRLIGLPGETIEVKAGTVYADGVELDNTFIRQEPQDESNDGIGIFRVPEGCYFVLGDNRNESSDSRFWFEAYVPAENICSKAKIIIFPFFSVGSVEYGK